MTSSASRRRDGSKRNPTQRTFKAGDRHAGGPSVDLPVEGGLVVHRTPEQQRFDKLSKEHERLLREIRKRQVQLATAQELVQEVSSQLSLHIAPIRQRFTTLVREIQRLFESLLSPQGRLSRRDKTKVRRIYHQVFEDLGLEELISKPEHDPSFAPFGETDPEHNGSGSKSAWSGGDADQGFAGAPPPGWDGSGRGGGGYSAAKPAEKTASTLRSLFRRLAVAFHPDSVQNDAEKSSRTQVMKDITRAYETGDLARLMELERQHLAELPTSNDGESLKRREEALRVANAELRRQAKAVANELKELSYELPFDIDLKAAGARDRALFEVESMLEACAEEEQQVTSTRDFVRDFADGKMNTATFVAGPAWASVFNDETVASNDVPFPLGDDFVEDVLAAFAAHLKQQSVRSSNERPKRSNSTNVGKTERASAPKQRPAKKR